MTQWEYLYIFVKFDFLQGRAEVLHVDGKKLTPKESLAHYLANLGKEGWEMLDQIYPSDVNAWEAFMFFKRRIAD